MFCGAGGLSLGLTRAGIKVVAGVDTDENCRYAFEHNIHAAFINTDIRKVNASDLATYFSQGSVRILAGCPPCQPFSKYRNGQDIYNDEKWGMLDEFKRIALEMRPEYITLENVPELLKRSIFQNFVTSIIDLGYTVVYKILNAQDFGSAQKRRRLVLIASRIGAIDLNKGKFGKPSTVKDKISHLPVICAGEQHSELRYHKSAKLSPLNLLRIRASKPGGTWHDWPKELVATCHTKESGKHYHNVYGRMEWEKQAPTITTMCFGFGNGRFGHPEQDRGLSMLEAAILQGFPEDYDFVSPNKAISIKNLSRMIGNAIPIEISTQVGKSIVLYYTNF